MVEFVLRCVSCGSVFPGEPRLFKCPSCGGLLDAVPRNPSFKPSGKGVWRYSGMLPDFGHRPGLGEGGTPLVEAPLAQGLRVFVKYEGSNPTGSFKDRGMAVAAPAAKAAGSKAVLVASTGNTSASASAYAARLGLRSVVVLPQGKVARGKLAQALLHGAVVAEVSGGFDTALELVRKASEDPRVYPLNSFNPWRLEGQKTLAYEVFEEIGVPDAVIVPVGNAGNISAIYKGFRELVELGVADRVPAMIGVQAAGASPLATAWERGSARPVWFDRPETIATAVRIGRPVNWPKAMRAVRESGGFFMKVGDEEILAAQRHLARRVGLGVEPAAALPVAALPHVKDRVEGTVVLVATGHALKDPETAAAEGRVIRLQSNSVESLLGGLE